MPSSKHKSAHKQMDSLMQGQVCWAKARSILQSRGWWKHYGTVVVLLQMTWELSTPFVQHCSAPVPLSATLLLSQEDIGSTAHCALVNSREAEQKPVRCEDTKSGGVSPWHRLLSSQAGALRYLQPPWALGSAPAELPREHEDTPWTISNLFKASEWVHVRSVVRFLVVITFFIRQQ